MPTYDTEGLKRGIQGCQKNIAVLKEAIKKEKDTVKEYETMIRDLDATRERVAARDKFVVDSQKQLDAENVNNDHPN